MDALLLIQHKGEETDPSGSRFRDTRLLGESSSENSRQGLTAESALSVQSRSDQTHQPPHVGHALSGLSHPSLDRREEICNFLLGRKWSGHRQGCFVFLYSSTLGWAHQGLSELLPLPQPALSHSPHCPLSQGLKVGPPSLSTSQKSLLDHGSPFPV